ncbi:MAG: hypothetical protein PHC34_13865 [Candidatus Gastranaerophilales bacterium]|nr:hypothetical protein [Candidatus Gastranaerophilales bacterium]
MYTVEQLKEKIEENDHFVDINEIGSYLKNWRIDPVYEDDDGIEYFDDLAASKFNQGIILKENGKNDEEVMLILNKGVINSTNMPTMKHTTLQVNDNPGEFKKVTVDITTQTLALLAESIAQKITTDITNKVKDTNIFNSAIDAGKLTRDNEILASQVKKLLKENQKLISRVSFLQQENAKFKHIFGSVYMKQE